MVTDAPDFKQDLWRICAGWFIKLSNTTKEDMKTNVDWLVFIELAFKHTYIAENGQGHFIWTALNQSYTLNCDCIVVETVVLKHKLYLLYSKQL